jgi:MmyB-like transcription regulator ligand binding domain
VPLQVSTAPYVNLLRLLFHPYGFRKGIVNWEAGAKALLNEAYRRLARAREEKLKALIAEILSYPGVPARRSEPELEGPHALILLMSSTWTKMARMFSPITTVSTPRDVTLQELHVEVFYPGDAETEATLQTFEARVNRLCGAIK